MREKGFDKRSIIIFYYLCEVITKHGVMYEVSVNVEPVPFPDLSDIVLQGGIANMLVLTILLIVLLIAVWRRSSLIKEIGISALVFGLFVSLIAVYQMCMSFTVYGSMDVAVWSGLKCAIVPLCYGVVIYGFSIIIRIVLKLKNNGQ